jgi:hypothetical protein
MQLPPHPALRAALSQLVSIYGERQAFAFGRGPSTEYTTILPSPLAGEGSRRRRVGEGALYSCWKMREALPDRRTT